MNHKVRGIITPRREAAHHLSYKASMLIKEGSVGKDDRVQIALG